MERWKHPRDYGGFSPDGDYVLLTQNRDSSALDRSNWRRICADLKAEDFDDGREHPENRPNVYTFRAGHWAVGWVKYLLIRADAPEELIREAEEIKGALADYPVYDESDFSDLEFSEAADYWERSSVRERVRLIQDSNCGASIFAARRPELPQDDNGRLLESLRD